jgi:hypothetical protein
MFFVRHRLDMGAHRTSVEYLEYKRVIFRFWQFVIKEIKQMSQMLSEYSLMWVSMVTEMLNSGHIVFRNCLIQY